MSSLAQTCRNHGMSPEMVEALGLMFLETADELRSGPPYPADGIGSDVRDRVMAAAGHA